VGIVAVPPADTPTWELTPHSDNSNMCSIVNVGTRPAINVRVTLLVGPHHLPTGRLVFQRIDPGSGFSVFRSSVDLDLPRWDRVTVIWREGPGWLLRRRRQWDSRSQSAAR
jgi:hypothetical protein